MLLAKNSLIIDSGYLLALFSQRDAFHKAAIRIRPQIENRPWITTWPVVTETCHLLTSIQPILATKMLQLCERRVLHLFDIGIEHIYRMNALMLKYQDLPMDLADASLVLLAEELGHGDIVSTDQRDFGTCRFKNHRPFRNLLV